MRFDQKAVSTPSTTGVGESIKVEEYVDKWVELANVAGGATFTIEGTFGDGTSGAAWSTLYPGTMNANGVYEVPENVRFVRMRRTANGTNTPAAAATLNWRDARAD